MSSDSEYYHDAPSNTIAVHKILSQQIDATLSNMKEEQALPNHEIEPPAIVTRPIGMPVAHTMNGSHNGTEWVTAENRYIELAREAKGWIVGPMPEELFLDRFLPYNTEKEPAPGTQTAFPTQSTLGCIPVVNTSISQDEGDTGEEPTTSKFEMMQFPVEKKEDLYEPLCTGLNASFEGPFRFVSTSSHQDPVNVMKPDICLYRDDVIKKFERTDRETQKITYVTDLSESELFCEVGKDDADDPFVDIPGKESHLPGPFGNEDVTDENTNNFVKRGCCQRAQRAIDEAIGRFTAYAMVVFSRQYRTHCFCIGIFGRKARFFRWDRAGVVISGAFDYREKPWLTEFLRRYCQATDGQRGYDASVCKATKAEEIKFEEKIKEHVEDLYAPKDGRAINSLMERHYEENKVFKVKIWPQNPKKLNIPPAHDTSVRKAPKIGKGEDLSWFERKHGRVENGGFDDIAEAKLALKDVEQAQATGEIMNKEEQKSICRRYVQDEQYQYFLVSRPVAVALSVAGRSTRGYWAVKIPDENAGDGPDDYRICFLKDTWQMDTKGTGWEAEGDVVVALYEAGVSSISDIFCHSDVSLSEDENLSESNHETVTNKYAKEEWNTNKPNYTSGKHNHYRMVSIEVGCPLRELLGAFELLEATRMAFIATLQALVKCGRFHGDISINNILITRKNGVFVAGFLIDWEFSCIFDKERRNYNRSGTWAYMSINILQNPITHVRGLRDDMESLYYVVSYCGIRWLPHNEVKNLGEDMDDYFYGRKKSGVDARGGYAKSANVANGHFKKLFQWVDKATKLWMSRAWMLQHYQGKVKNSWNPKDLMEIWTDALMLNPSRVDRVEHVIKLQGRNITSAVFPTSASLFSYSVSHISCKMCASLKLPNTQTSRSMKRDIEEAQREPEIAKDRAYACTEEMDDMLPASKRLRLHVATPKPDA